MTLPMFKGISAKINDSDLKNVFIRETENDITVGYSPQENQTVIRPDWITKSLSQGHLLPITDFMVTALSQESRYGLLGIQPLDLQNIDPNQCEDWIPDNPDFVAIKID